MSHQRHLKVQGVRFRGLAGIKHHTHIVMFLRIPQAVGLYKLSYMDVCGLLLLNSSRRSNKPSKKVQAPCLFVLMEVDSLLVPSSRRHRSISLMSPLSLHPFLLCIILAHLHPQCELKLFESVSTLPCSVSECYLV